jgi:hypothetical protein
MQGRLAVIARGLLLCALLLSSCSPGPPLVLGRLPDAGDEDASVFDPCETRDDCTSKERPYCDLELEHCVECLGDSHCRADEWCSSRRGRCVDDDR